MSRSPTYPLSLSTTKPDPSCVDAFSVSKWYAKDHLMTTTLRRTRSWASCHSSMRNSCNGVSRPLRPKSFSLAMLLPFGESTALRLPRYIYSSVAAAFLPPDPRNVGCMPAIRVGEKRDRSVWFGNVHASAPAFRADSGFIGFCSRHLMNSFLPASSACSALHPKDKGDGRRCSAGACPSSGGYLIGPAMASLGGRRGP
jgi:hypothetical protein